MVSGPWAHHCNVPRLFIHILGSRTGVCDWPAFCARHSNRKWTSLNNTKNSQYDTSGKISRNISSIKMKNIKSFFKEYIYFELAVAVFTLLCVLIYFPSKPKAPPSRSSTEKRHNFSLGLKRLLSHGSFWLLAGLFCGAVRSHWFVVSNTWRHIVQIWYRTDNRRLARMCFNAWRIH